jgi:hypothetical protein
MRIKSETRNLVEAIRWHQRESGQEDVELVILAIGSEWIQAPANVLLGDSFIVNIPNSEIKTVFRV